MHLEMIDDHDLEQWQLSYKQCLNDPDIRQRLSGRDDALGYLEIQEANPRNVSWIRPIGKRGTVELVYRGGNQAHYLAYYPDTSSDRFVVFDPSGGVGGAFEPFDWWNKGLTVALGNFRWYENITPLQQENPYHGESDDTWCQSWSLAMLHPSLQKDVQTYAEQPDADYLTRREQARTVVTFFAYHLRSSDMSPLEWVRHDQFLNEFVLDRAWDKMYDDVATPVTARLASRYRPGHGGRKLRYR